MLYRILVNRVKKANPDLNSENEVKNKIMEQTDGKHLITHESIKMYN